MEVLIIAIILCAFFIAYSYNFKNGNSEKKYPILTNEMFSNLSNEISTAEAKKLFKKFMLDIKFLDKDEISNHLEYFSEAMSSMENYLIEEVSSAKESLKESIKEANDFDGLDENEIKQAIATVNLYTKQFEENLQNAETKLKQFKRDKRDFLINYINNQTQN